MRASMRVAVITLIAKTLWQRFMREFDEFYSIRRRLLRCHHSASATGALCKGQVHARKCIVVSAGSLHTPCLLKRYMLAWCSRSWPHWCML